MCATQYVWLPPTEHQSTELDAVFPRPQCRCVTLEGSTLLHTVRSRRVRIEEADTVEDRHRHADQRLPIPRVLTHT